MSNKSFYNKDDADYAVSFIEALSHTKGLWAGKPFELIDWQEQIIRDVFGILKPDGFRQFNTAYVEIPKKMGKSELAAAIALLLTCGDDEERAEVYGCAADRQQASIVFEVAADMVRMCPALSKRVKLLASTKRLVYLPTNSFYQVLSAEAYSKHGFNVHGVVFDELHTQPNRKLFDVMTKGSGDARTQPLYFLITTAGTIQIASALRLIKKQSISLMAENMIFHFILSSTGRRRVMIGLTPRYGKRLTHLLESLLVLTRCMPHARAQSKIPLRRTAFGSFV